VPANPLSATMGSGNALYSRGIHVTELPISAELVLEAVDDRDGRDEAPAMAGAAPVSANGHEGDKLGEKVFAAGTPRGSAMAQNAPDGKAAGLLTGARRLATSESSKLFFGTLGVGLVPILLIWLFRRGGENS
jgi:hypothetical protein